MVLPCTLVYDTDRCVMAMFIDLGWMHEGFGMDTQERKSTADIGEASQLRKLEEV